MNLILIWSQECLYIGRYEQGHPVITREAAFETGVSLLGARTMYPDEHILVSLSI